MILLLRACNRNTNDLAYIYDFDTLSIFKVLGLTLYLCVLMLPSLVRLGKELYYSKYVLEIFKYLFWF